MTGGQEEFSVGVSSGQQLREFRHKRMGSLGLLPDGYWRCLQALSMEHLSISCTESLPLCSWLHPSWGKSWRVWRSHVLHFWRRKPQCVHRSQSLLQIKALKTTLINTTGWWPPHFPPRPQTYNMPFKRNLASLCYVCSMEHMLTAFIIHLSHNTAAGTKPRWRGRVGGGGGGSLLFNPHPHHNSNCGAKEARLRRTNGRVPSQGKCLAPLRAQR